RIIREGVYWIVKEKLHTTPFPSDPELAMTTSNVNSLLGETGGVRMCTAERGEKHPREKVSVGIAETTGDLQQWAKESKEKMVLAGAAGFFMALLEDRGAVQRASSSSEKLHFPDKKKLMVCGSAFPGSRTFVKEARQDGKAVSL